MEQTISTNERGGYEITLQCLDGPCPPNPPLNPDIIVTPTGSLTTTEAGGTASFTVVLTRPPTDDVTIGLSSSNTDEGTVSPNSLTFTSANWNTAQPVTVTGVDDGAVVDGNVSYSIITAPASSDDPDYDGINPPDVAVTNVDDDVSPPDIFVSSISGNTSEDGAVATFSVVLSDQPTADVTIALSSSDITEGTVAPASLVFTPANGRQPQTVTVTGRNDAEVDGDINYLIITAPASSGDLNYNGRNPADVKATNTDNDDGDGLNSIFADDFEN